MRKITIIFIFLFSLTNAFASIKEEVRELIQDKWQQDVCIDNAIDLKKVGYWGFNSSEIDHNDGASAIDQSINALESLEESQQLYLELKSEVLRIDQVRQDVFNDSAIEMEAVSCQSLILELNKASNLYLPKPLLLPRFSNTDIAAMDVFNATVNFILKNGLQLIDEYLEYEVKGHEGKTGNGISPDRDENGPIFEGKTGNGYHQPLLPKDIFNKALKFTNKVFKK